MRLPSAADGVASRDPKSSPEIVTIAPPVCGRLGAPFERTGASNVKRRASGEVVPAVVATVRPTLSDGPVYAGASQSTAVAVVHDVVPQVRMLTWLVTVRSAEAKPSPVIVSEVAPVAAPFGRASCETIAASYVNMFRIVPTTAETVKKAVSLTPLPVLGIRHCTEVSVFHSVDAQTVFPS
jgi:hypothetical protein